MRQWFGVSAKAVLNTRWTQFINHANYKIIDANFKIIDSNVMDWANVTKIHTPPSAKRYFSPWRACAVQRQFRDREWRAIESHCWHRTGWWKCVIPVSWTLNINAWCSNCLFAINSQCFKKTREDVEGWTAGKIVAYCEACDRGLVTVVFRVWYNVRN